MKNNEPVIEVKGFARPSRQRGARSFDLTLYRAKISWCWAKSGSGKSVLIRCIIGLRAPGRAHHAGAKLPDLTYGAGTNWRPRRFSYSRAMPLYDSMTVRKTSNSLRRHWMNVEQNEVNDLVHEVLTSVGLAHTVDMMPAELSGGMRKRMLWPARSSSNPTSSCTTNPPPALTP
ncbi:MAG: ATP-binding cassette domain-containing protein [Lewinellaceae bacterium]|nr:ATP-binding cassette domain-containing protein [Lewinellaceae bacterium]